MMFSFIVPTYNEEKYISKCLSSLKNQKTTHKYEIIVVDAKSTDKTVRIARKYADRILLSDVCSVALQRNSGAKAAKGKYLVFVDADTQLFDSYLEEALSYMLDGYSAISFGFEFDKKKPEFVVAQKITNVYLHLKSKLGIATLPGFNIVIPEDVFLMAGGFRNTVLEDIEISKRLRKIGKTGYFVDHFVITSARKLERMGVLESLRYYAELDISSSIKFDRYKNLFKYDRYVHVR